MDGRISILKSLINIKSVEIAELAQELATLLVGEDDQVLTAAEAALNNPLILTNILDHMGKVNGADLLKLRLVGKAWNEVILHTPSFYNKIRLNLTKMFPCCTIEPVVPPINPQLTRNVFITDKCYNNNDPYQKEEESTESVYTLMTKIRHLHPDDYRPPCEKLLVGSEVRTTYDDGDKTYDDDDKTYIIKEINWNARPTDTFRHKGKQVSFMNDYLSRQITITVPTQPLLSASRTRPCRYTRTEDTTVLLVPELCYQSPEMKYNFHKMKGQGTAVHNMKTFLNGYSQNVENITFHGQDCDIFYTHLVNALHKLEFGNLKGIRFLDNYETIGFYYCIWDWEDQHFAPIPPFPTRRNLTSLQLKDTIAGSPFHDLFERLINSAPNLEKLSIYGNFYPDLSNSKNLKILEYHGIPFYYEERKCVWQENSFNLEALSRMLTQVKISLVKLTLADSYLCADLNGHVQQGQFKFPDVMEKLEFLSIEEGTRTPFFLQEMKKISPLQFPKLTTLLIEMNGMDDVVGGISDSFVKISSLSIGGTVSPDVRIPFLFPNLSNLTMSMSSTFEFDAVIDFCTGWRLLRNLDICCKFPSNLWKLTKGIEKMRQSQKDLQILKLGFNKSYVLDLWFSKENNSSEYISNISMPTLTFGSYSLKALDADTVFKTVLKHDLIIHFI